MPDIYRQAASMLLVRKAPMRGREKEPLQLLLLHKPRKKDAWQLPQGGVEEGESVEQAALRELQEEAGISDATLVKVSDVVYEYDFPTSYRRFRPDNVRGQQIAFVIAEVLPDAVVKVDNHEIDQYVWVYLGEVTRYIRRQEYLALVRKLYAEAVEILSR